MAPLVVHGGAARGSAAWSRSPEQHHLQRLFEQDFIMFAWLERRDRLVVVGLPAFKHVFHGKDAALLLRKDSVRRRCTHGWQSRYQTVRVGDIRP